MSFCARKCDESRRCPWHLALPAWHESSWHGRLQCARTIIMDCSASCLGLLQLQRIDYVRGFQPCWLVATLAWLYCVRLAISTHENQLWQHQTLRSVFSLSTPRLRLRFCPVLYNYLVDYISCIFQRHAIALNIIRLGLQLYRGQRG